ncbi:hypothetical protein M758_8G032600 [Ceratodon purpureus]|nr:hypothetical protein M758_8G032600 [Ceratodon purpureus]
MSNNRWFHLMVGAGVGQDETVTYENQKSGPQSQRSTPGGTKLSYTKLKRGGSTTVAASFTAKLHMTNPSHPASRRLPILTHQFPELGPSQTPRSLITNTSHRSTQRPTSTSF